MNILIFGVTGNCGKYCAQRFIQDGHNVVGVARSKLDISVAGLTSIQGDIREKAFFSKLPSDFDLVVNFAGVQPSILPTSENTNLDATLQAYLDVNIGGVFNVLEYVRKSNIGSYVYATTHRDVELTWEQGKFLENEEPININYNGDHSMYAISKTSGKMMGDYYSNAFGIRVFNLRLPMIFLVPDSQYYLKDGKRTVMPFLQIIKKALAGEPLEIWGDRHLKRDYVYVENLYNLICLVHRSNLLRGTFAVGTGEAVTTEDFVKAIAREFSPDPDTVEYVYKPNIKTYKCAIYNTSQQKTIGYKPILLDEMLAKMHNEILIGNCQTKWGWVK